MQSTNEAAIRKLADDTGVPHDELVEAIAKRKGEVLTQATLLRAREHFRSAAQMRPVPRPIKRPPTDDPAKHRVVLKGHAKRKSLVRH